LQNSREAQLNEAKNPTSANLRQLLCDEMAGHHDEQAGTGALDASALRLNHGELIENRRSINLLTFSFNRLIVMAVGAPDAQETTVEVVSR
jgi:hypothetical protein